MKDAGELDKRLSQYLDQQLEKNEKQKSPMEFLEEILSDMNGAIIVEETAIMALQANAKTQAKISEKIQQFLKSNEKGQKYEAQKEQREDPENEAT